MRYFRAIQETQAVEELTEERYRELAFGNVHNVNMAVEVGFQTSGAEYWTEPA